MNRLSLDQICESINRVLGGGDILLINPPFATHKNPKLGLHILQVIGKEKGFKTDILYLNLLLASFIGLDTAQRIAVQSLFSYWKMTAERLFARAAHGLPPLGTRPELQLDEAMSVSGKKEGYVDTCYACKQLDMEVLEKLETNCFRFMEGVIPVIASLGYKIIGVTTQLGQINAGVSLLKGLKKIQNDIITIQGGAGCEGEMAEGIASLSKSTDYIFSGESEITYGAFLYDISRGNLPRRRVIHGESLKDLDSLPLPRYDDFIRQMNVFIDIGEPGKTSIPYETSRGCWWAMKNKCRFCGISDGKYRQKSAGKVLNDLEQLNKRYRGRGVMMTDSIMPQTYHKEVIPRLNEKKFSHMYYHYQIKANLSFQELANLKAGGATIITPGMEALSSGLLELLNKGITVGENILLLRSARSLGLFVYWHLLWGIPGDQESFYQETLDLLPLISHLQPPREINHIQLERFSAYLEEPERLGLQNIRPLAAYRDIFPQSTNIGKLAYFFTADYPCESHSRPETIGKLIAYWQSWKKMWRQSVLVMVPCADFFVIKDMRQIWEKTLIHTLKSEEALEIMTPRLYRQSDILDWALKQKLGIIIDNQYIPLVTAPVEVLAGFEKEADQKMF